MLTMHFPDDDVFRLAFTPSVKEGDWYLGVVCHHCSKPILVLVDKSGGWAPYPITGEGKLAIICHHCGTDDLYLAKSLQTFQATYSYQSFKDRRPKPSGSSRQPLLRKYRNAKPIFGIGALEQRPEAAQIIARCIAYWTDVESQTARLLATILKANTEPAIALYLSLQNARAKNDAMHAAAATTLSPQDFELFSALMAFKGSVEKERNNLAHGIFGFAQAVETGIVWIDTTTWTQRFAQAIIQKERPRDTASKCFVYEIGDLETIAQDIENLHNQIGFFIGYLDSDNVEFRTKRYPQLCAEPRVQKELARLRQKTQQEDCD